jgi:M6 family metalloprotease-like protein
MKIFFLSLLCILSVNVFAAPYWGELQKFKQPDGTWVDVKLYGDEYYIRGEGLDGYTLIRDEQTGWICYAVISGNGAELLPTTIHYNGRENDASTLRSGLNIPQHLERSTEIFAKIREANNRKLNGDLPLNRYQNREADAPAPPIGNVKGLSIIVDFSDEPASLPMSDFEDFLNGANFTKFGNNGSVKKYYSDVTNGLLIYDNIVYGYFRAPKTFKQYDAMSYAAGAKEILGLALNWIKSKGFDFSTLTIANGRIRAINLMYTGHPPTWAQGMWFHQGSYSGFSANGVTSGSYNCSPANEPLSLGVVCHENGHMIGEWPDTYKYASNTGTDGLGTFDLMCAYGSVYNPVPPNPYFLSRNGFGKTVDVTDIGMDINDPANAFTYYKYRNKNNAKEWFLVQAKMKIDRSKGLPDQGVTIWRVNTAGSNQSTTHEISLVHCNNNKDVHTGACYKAGKQEFSDNTIPNAKWLNGSTSGLRIWDFGAAGGLTMHYKIGTSTGITGEDLARQVSIYPNPIADGILQIDLSGFQNDQAIVITIQDAQGRVVFKKEEQQKNSVNIQTQSFDSGVYFINLSSGNYSSNHKLVKQ